MKARNTRCPHCGQRLAGDRFGIVFGPIQVRIIDAIRRAGADGILAADLRGLIYGDNKVCRQVISQHVHQINGALLATDYAIRGGTGKPYRLVRLKSLSPSPHTNGATDHVG